MSKFVVHCTWEEVPHLSEEQKADLLASIPPYQRDARSKGIPQLGSGAIYPLPESDIVVPDFELPEHYVRAYGMDVGWRHNAGVWGARDLETGVTYLYSCHKRGQAEPAVVAQGIRARGEWIPGVIDPSARGRSKKDGHRLIEQYRDLGLYLQIADSSVEAGIVKTWQLLSAGQIKVFKSLLPWFEEFRLYRRDDKGAIVKENDHLMDATRYLVMSGIDRMKTKPFKIEDRSRYLHPGPGESSWMM